MKKEPWVGNPPISSSKPVVQRFKETDDDGSEWYVALGPTGEPVERALLTPRGKRLTEMQAAHAVTQADYDKRKAAEARMEQLKQKRLQGGTLTPAEQQEVLDSILGL